MQQNVGVLHDDIRFQIPQPTASAVVPHGPAGADDPLVVLLPIRVRVFGPVRAQPAEIHFGMVRPGQPVEQTVLLTTRPGQPLFRVAGVETTAGLSAVGVDTETWATRHEVQVAPRSGATGAVTGNVRIQTVDAEGLHDLLTVPVSVYVYQLSGDGATRLRQPGEAPRPTDVSAQPITVEKTR